MQNNAPQAEASSGGAPYATVYAVLKRALAIGTVSPTDIKADMLLLEKPLRFDALGLRDLAPRLNQWFETEAGEVPNSALRGLSLTEDQTGAAKTVRDLADLIYNALN